MEIQLHVTKANKANQPTNKSMKKQRENQNRSSVQFSSVA